MICIFSDRHGRCAGGSWRFRRGFKKIEASRGVDLKTDAGRWNARRTLCRDRALSPR
jgi:2-methylfumaryl-CoA isomerase